MQSYEADKLHTLGVSKEQIATLKAKGLGFAGILAAIKFLISLLGGLGGGSPSAGATRAPMPAADTEKLRAVGVTDAEMATLASHGLDFAKIMAFIMGLLKLVQDSGIFTGAPAVPPQ